ncbi:hypothetical protein L6R52_14395 [Myxococcota bacterium]|nr:hypothetical protein [Myxococcota bacterium]
MPATVRLDASASSASDGAALVARFDVDGDGAFDTDVGALAIDHRYEAAGTVTPRVELRDASGATAIASATLVLVENTLPVVALAVTPASGKAPLAITADASGSTDADEPASALRARFDFDGDGTFDTPLDAAKRATWSYTRAGRFTVIAEVEDAQRGTARATATVDVSPSADLDADTDRDGELTELDEAFEDRFDADHGAVFVANLDDDDGDGRRDGSDGDLDGAADLADLAALSVRAYPGLAGADRVTITVDEAARGDVRLFVEGADGVVSQLFAPGGDATVSLPTERVAAEDVRLFVEATRGRSATWDGRLTLTLTVEHGGLVEEDAVALRAAPIIFPDNLQRAEVLYLMRITDPELGPNREMFDAITQNLPEGVVTHTVDQYRYWGDRWVQDTMQTGYQVMPAPGGDHVVETYLQTLRPTADEGLEYLLPRELLGADLGYSGVSGPDTSLNYGGNLEISGPITVNGVEHPFGRFLVGGGDLGLLDGTPYEDHMAAVQRALLEAQGSQGPIVEMPTEWLAVGHIDEIIQVVPDHRPEAARPWKVVITSPALARRALEEVQAAGGGALRVFRGRDVETSVDAILGNATLMAFNDAAQSRVDTVREILVNELGLGDDDFVEVPVLYEPIRFGRMSLAAAYNPGIQNLVTLDPKLFVPDPEGPETANGDPWEVQTREALEPLGLEVVFVDVFDSYHVNLGEAHCGTEVRRAPYARAWWEAE